MFWPFDHAHHPVRQGLCGRVVALREGQQESQGPDDTDDHFGGCGWQPGLEGMDDGHVPGTEKKRQSSDLVTKIYVSDYTLFLTMKNSWKPLTPGDFYNYFLIPFSCSVLKSYDSYDIKR